MQQFHTINQLMERAMAANCAEIRAFFNPVDKPACIETVLKEIYL